MLQLTEFLRGPGAGRSTRPFIFGQQKKDRTFIRSLRGDTRNRTGDEGFADPRLTAWLCRLITLVK